MRYLFLLLASLIAHPCLAQVDAFASAILQHGQDPVDYIADKFKTHYVVSLGEDHWIKDHPLFVSELLKALEGRTDSVGVDVLAFEFGNSADQPLADTLASSPVWREDLAIKILQHAPDIYGNPYLEHMNVLKTVWQINLNREKGKMKILLLDPPYMIPYLNGEPYTATYDRDESMKNLLRGYILARQRILFYAGLGHTRKAVNGSYIPTNNIYYNYLSAGFLLETLYPDFVFSIKLWGALMGGNGYNPVEGQERWERVYNGDIDRAFVANGNKPVAFDIDIAPFSELTVAQFYKTSQTTLDRAKDKMVGSPYGGNKPLADDIDGIIFFKPVEEFSGATVCGKFFDDEFVELIGRRTNGEVKTRKEVFEYIKKGHPIMSESLDKLLENE
jgi:hypothetical protein